VRPIRLSGGALTAPVSKLTSYRWRPFTTGSYLMLGMAIRIGMDMDIGRPLPHLDERRNRSRMRCWIGLFNADRRFGGCGQVQKPEIMPEDAVIRASCVLRPNKLA
jgi:hypothetical protein